MRLQEMSVKKKVLVADDDQGIFELEDRTWTYKSIETINGEKGKRKKGGKKPRKKATTSQK